VRNRTLRNQKNTPNNPRQQHTLEGGGVQVIEDNLLHLLVDLLLLAEDDIALTLNSLVVQGRVLEDIREDLNRLGDIGLEGLGVVDSLLARGVGVQVSAHVLNLDLKVVLTTSVGALSMNIVNRRLDPSFNELLHTLPVTMLSPRAVLRVQAVVAGLFLATFCIHELFSTRNVSFAILKVSFRPITLKAICSKK